MIVATAGHVDHGKTSLIRQLTGVETDRLEEEKRRGLSINLGYAYLPVEGETPLGFIDVPGHQRFINTMISGISGIDLGMLVVAADDGPMPQTQEHLDVLQILGVKDVVLVVSKVDRVDAVRVEEVQADSRALLQARGLPLAQSFFVDNVLGDGIAPLKAYLLERNAQHQTQSSTGCFRLSIDRAFTVKGAGIVVTGTSCSGTVQAGDTLRLMPADKEVRVRSLRVHDTEAQEANAGARCALNLAGNIALEDIQRGDWLLQPEAGAPSARIDIAFDLLAGAPFPLKHLAPVKVYLGAQRLPARLALLRTDSSGKGGGKKLLPGEQCLGQLVFENPVSGYSGQRFLLRDDAESCILGGGSILDPQGKAQRKSSAERLACLDAMRSSSSADVMQQLLQLNQLIDMDKFAQARNMTSEEAALFVPPADAKSFEGDGKQWATSASRWNVAQDALRDTLQQWHDANPTESGMKAGVLQLELKKQNSAALIKALITAQISANEIALKEGRLRLVSFKPRQSSKGEITWQKYSDFLIERAVQIPLLSETTEETKVPIAELQKAGAAAAREGNAHKISERRYALPQHLALLCEAILSLDEKGEEISVIELKKQWGLGRNLVVEIVEYFDSVRFTARRGNGRVVLDRALPQKLFGK